VCDVRGKKRSSEPKRPFQRHKLWRAIELLENRVLLSGVTSTDAAQSPALSSFAVTAAATTPPSDTET
jgi:hypothetical protein